MIDWIVECFTTPRLLLTPVKEFTIVAVFLVPFAAILLAAKLLDFIRPFGEWRWKR